MTKVIRSEKDVESAEEGAELRSHLLKVSHITIQNRSHSESEPY